jgi:methylenetetrahydrofolate--tRNA-(uracil-5-)-methyltransferase
MTQTVNVIGAGLAGSEAAYQLAERGIKVNLTIRLTLIPLSAN